MTGTLSAYHAGAAVVAGAAGGAAQWTRGGRNEADFEKAEGSTKQHGGEDKDGGGGNDDETGVKRHPKGEL